MNQIKCSGCGSEDVTENSRSQSGKVISIKVECSKCGRLIGYRSPDTIAPKLHWESPPTLPVATTAHSEQSIQSDIANGDRKPTDPPESWLYVSRKLDFEWLPNAPLWSAPVITFGRSAAKCSNTSKDSKPPPSPPPIVYYRLTPGVFVWLELAGMSMEKMTIAGSVLRSQLDEYLSLMATVQEFAAAYLDGGAIADARVEAKVRPPVLPSQAA